MSSHSEFFKSFIEDVSQVVNHPKYKTPFRFGWGGMESYVYSVSIIHSLYRVSAKQLAGCVILTKQGETVNRGVVHANLVRFFESLYDIGIKAPLVDNSLKIMMVLEKTIVNNKIYMYSPAGFNTQVYLRFNLVDDTNPTSVIVLEYGRRPFTGVGKYMLSASLLTLGRVVRKSTNQSAENSINEKAAIAASSVPLSLNTGGWLSTVRDILVEWGCNLGGEFKTVDELEFLAKKHMRLCIQKLDHIEERLVESSRAWARYVGSYCIDAQIKDNEVLEPDELEDPERSDRRRKSKTLKEAASAPAGLALKSNEEFWLKARHEAQKEAQHCRELLIGCALSRVKGCFYLGHFYDFRGRTYEENEN